MRAAGCCILSLILKLCFSTKIAAFDGWIARKTCLSMPIVIQFWRMDCAFCLWQVACLYVSWFKGFILLANTPEPNKISGTNMSSITKAVIVKVHEIVIGHLDWKTVYTILELELHLLHDFTLFLPSSALKLFLVMQCCQLYPCGNTAS